MMKEEGGVFPSYPSLSNVKEQNQGGGVVRGGGGQCFTSLCCSYLFFLGSMIDRTLFREGEEWEGKGLLVLALDPKTLLVIDLLQFSSVQFSSVQFSSDQTKHGERAASRLLGMARLK